MNTNEFLSFITPQIEPLQLSFFVIILAMFFGSIISTWLNANSDSWEKNWNNGTPDDSSDDLDIDHGSITDLWQAVATKSEKMAEIMPSMLLVVGLLGTFLGLGLALNHASNILGQSNALSATGTANSMSDLMSMMQGLGTKFKTSTWGITFFLLLKIWSSWTGFDEKRLTWVILKVKDELERRKEEIQRANENKQQMLFAQINQAAEFIIKGFNQSLEQLAERGKIQHQQSFQLLGKGVQAIHGNLVNIQKIMQNESIATKLALVNINTTIKNVSDVTKQVLEQTTVGIRGDLADISSATKNSSEAMVGFVNSTQTIIKDMSAASNKMADGAHKVGVAGSSLVKAVDDFSNQFTQVLGDVRTDLSAAINDMSEQAAHTLEQGTTKLGEATREISAALGILSQDVTTTMNGVKDSIEKSLKIQQDGAVLFRRSSDTLNDNVTATTELVQKLGEDIRSGLQAVSDSGRRMASIGKSLENIVPKMEDLAPALEPLKILPAQHQALISEIQGMRQDFRLRIQPKPTASTIAPIKTNQ